MPTTAHLGLAAALLAAVAATPALAQTGYGSQGGYPQSGYGSQGYGQQGSSPTSGYGSPQAYPPSTYDRGSNGYPSSGRPGDYGGAERYGRPESMDQGQGGDQAQDPEALARRLNLTASQRPAYDAYRRAFQPDEARARARRRTRCAAWPRADHAAAAGHGPRLPRPRPRRLRPHRLGHAHLLRPAEPRPAPHLRPADRPADGRGRPRPGRRSEPDAARGPSAAVGSRSRSSPRRRGSPDARAHRRCSPGARSPACAGWADGRKLERAKRKDVRSHRGC